MSQSPGSPLPTDDLQFNTVEPAANSAVPTALACAGCGQPLTDRYFAVGAKVICGNCCARFTAPPRGNSAVAYAIAMVYGLGAAILGAVGWYAIVEATGWEIGYVAIGVGYIVGKSIRKGAGGRGGPEYQVLAVILTYIAMTATYAAIFAKAVYGRDPNRIFESRMVLAMAKFAIERPFLGGAQSILGILIIGFALVQAWRMTAARKLPISGPFQVGPRAPLATVAGVRP